MAHEVGGQIVLNPEESRIFREIVNHPSEEAARKRDEGLKRLDALGFQETETGFTFWLPKEDTP